MAESILISYLQYPPVFGNRGHAQYVCGAEIEEKILPFPGVAQEMFMVGSPGRHFPWISQNDPLGKEGKKEVLLTF